MNKNNIEKAITYDNTKVALDELKNLMAKRDEQLEFPFEKPQSEEIIEFKPKPGSPILEWYKSNKDQIKNIASVDEIAPFLSQFYSEKQLLQMH